MITMHHHIESSKSRNKFFRFQSAQSFNAQIQYLASNFSYPYEKKLGSQDNTFHITLDDGLKSHLDAAKILEKNNVYGTFYYLTSTPLGKSVLNVHLGHILLKYLDHTAKVSLLSDLSDVSGSRDDISETKFVYRHQGNYQIDMEIKSKINYTCGPKNVRNILIYYLGKQTNLSENEINKEIYLTISDLKNLKNNGHRVLPHFHSHTLLSLLSFKELELEFDNMINFHKEHFGLSPQEVCVPFGSKKSWTQQCEKIAMKHGIRNIILVDKVKDIFPEYSDAINYIERIDCCRLPNYRYI